MNGSQHINSAVRPKAHLRRRFSLVAAGLLSVLMAVLGVNFAADTGTSSASVEEIDGITVGNGSIPSWSVSVGSAGTVPTAGVVATIDPGEITATKMLVSVYITNLSELAVNYSSWNFNLGLFDNAATPNRIGTQQVITSDSGTVTWVVPVDATKTYTVKLETGGSFYTIDTVGTPTNPGTGSLSPAFFVRATEL